MGEMVLDRVNLAAPLLPWKRTLDDVAKARARAPDAQALQDETRVGAFRDDVGELAPQIGARALIEREMLDVGELDPRFRQTPFDRLGREAGPVLDAAKPLLLGGGDQQAI